MTTKLTSRTLMFFAPMAIIGYGSIFAILGGLLLFNSNLNKSREKIIKNLNDCPVSIQYKNMNQDSIEDRVLSSDVGLYQIQFGYDVGGGKIEYLTIDQIKEKFSSENSSKLEVELTKYEVKEKGR